MKHHSLPILLVVAVLAAGLSGCETKPQGIDATRRACDEGSASECATLGYAYEAGKEVPRDLVRAAALFSQACDGQDALACWTLGTYYETGKVIAADVLKAAGLYQKACELGDSNGCVFLGVLYRDGKGVAQDGVRARELVDRACALKSPMCESMRQNQQ